MREAAETAGGCYAQQRTAPKPRPAGAERSRAVAALICPADTVSHHFEATGGPAAVSDGSKSVMQNAPNNDRLLTD
ncbi:MAG: hypothetical protein LBD24_05320 [Spirochaetaceae bacterium]|jgi:hypothetical protein|nr:hypothetical protein [Spirochaetaceae bacterium]